MAWSVPRFDHCRGPTCPCQRVIFEYFATSVAFTALSALPVCAAVRLEYTPDPKVENAGVFKIEREDHTLGNLLRMQLLEDDRVVFVGYRQPHPLEHHILLRVQTSAACTPRQAVFQAIECLTTELDSIKTALLRSGLVDVQMDYN